jgi:hypothetical protein
MEQVHLYGAMAENMKESTWMIKSNLKKKLIYFYKKLSINYFKCIFFKAWTWCFHLARWKKI